jgi:CRP-like cAMP-binding protein
MGNSLITKLSNFSDLDQQSCREVEKLTRDVREFNAKQEIIGHGDQPDCLHLMVEGWAARYKSLRNGGRQIVGFMIPGDFCDLHVQMLGAMDHSIVALNPCKVAFISSAEFDKLTHGNASLTRALWWTTLVDEAVLREWVLNAGRRGAYEASAHLMCEMHFRMEQVGLVEDGDELSLPLTQEELADALGITPVHTNRVLRHLKEEHLITLSGKTLIIHDLPRLRRVAGFDKEYLHLQPKLAG